jgi:hypothetical protein
VTRYVIPEACTKIVDTIVSAKRDVLHDASNICKTRVTQDPIQWERPHHGILTRELTEDLDRHVLSYQSGPH